MLTGRPPFMGDSPMSVAFQHVSTEAPPPSSLNPDVPESLDAVVTKALRKDPAGRYQTAAEMRQDLLSVLKGDRVETAPAAVAGAGGKDATRIMSTVPPPTVPPDEVYRQIEEEPPSQMPFIITAFLLLLVLGGLFFFLFRALGGGEDEVEFIPVPNVVGLTQESAIDRLLADGFVPVPAFESSDEYEPGIVTRTDPEGGQEAEVGSTVDLYVSTGSAQFPVPPVIGQLLEDARIAIENANLEVGQIERRADADFAEGVVIDQNPAAGVEVGEGTPVNLVVSLGPEVIVLPDVTETTEREATSELHGLGLEVAVNEEFSGEVAEGLVIRTDPEPGSEVLSGDTILLVVSLGREPVEVPNLLNLTSGEAEALLADLGLVLRVSNSTQPVADPEQDGLVVNQVPTPGTTVDRGSTVTVTLGEFQPPPTTTTTSTTATTTTPPTTETTAAAASGG